MTLPLQIGGKQYGIQGWYTAVAGLDPSGNPAIITLNGAGALTTATSPPVYTGTPSNFTPATADATVFTLAAGEVGFIQNLDDAGLAVKKGASASSSDFSFVLAPGAAADDGKGEKVIIDDWVGAVSVAAMTGTARYIAWKQAP